MVAGVPIMKKIAVLALLFSLTALSIQTSRGQSRPRRVGQTSQPQQQPAQQPSSAQADDQSDEASQPARPSRPPVLGGANRDPNEQKPASTTPKNTGPEEVGEGDVIRVSTTLVSLPVSVMDRDGKYIPNLR